jgi:nicotinamidase-related amidase
MPKDKLNFSFPKQSMLGSYQSLSQDEEEEIVSEPISTHFAIEMPTAHSSSSFSSSTLDNKLQQQEQKRRQTYYIVGFTLFFFFLISALAILKYGENTTNNLSFSSSSSSKQRQREQEEIEEMIISQYPRCLSHCHDPCIDTKVNIIIITINSTIALLNYFIYYIYLCILMIIDETS